MKYTIIGILSKGYYDGKKYKSEDLCKKLYFLKYIIQNSDVLQIMNKPNKFWNFGNNQNRRELIDDIRRVHQFKMTDNFYFHIMNRFENGDGYGIQKEAE